MSLIPVSHVCHPCIVFQTDLRCTGISGLNPKASARVSRYELSHNFGRQTLGSCHLVREGVKNMFKESVDKVDLSTCHLVSWRILELVRLFFCACVCVCVGLFGSTIGKLLPFQQNSQRILQPNYIFQCSSC